MENISEFFNYIGRTNLFNFAIFLGIIIFLCKKIDVSGKLEAAKQTVADNIENSKTTKEKSEKALKEIEESVSHIEEEIDLIIKKSEENAKLVGSKILDDAKNVISNINDNSQKAIEAKTGLLKNELLRKALNASIDVAQNHIVKELKNNADLHNKLIDESIDALDGVGL